MDFRTRKTQVLLLTGCAALGLAPHGRRVCGKQVSSRFPHMGVWESDKMSHAKCLAHA